MDLSPASQNFYLFKEALANGNYCLAEFGCYNGGSTKQLASFGLPVWAFDTFEGIPAEDYDPELDFSDPPGKWRSGAPPEELFAGYPNIIPVKGRFIDTVSKIPPEVRFLLVHIDCDLYASYKQVFEVLPKHLVPGAIIVCDDYYVCAGATKAVNEFVKQYVVPHYDKVIRWIP